MEWINQLEIMDHIGIIIPILFALIIVPFVVYFVTTFSRLAFYNVTEYNAWIVTKDRTRKVCHFESSMLYDNMINLKEEEKLRIKVNARHYPYQYHEIKEKLLEKIKHTTRGVVWHTRIEKTDSGTYLISSIFCTSQDQPENHYWILYSYEGTKEYVYNIKCINKERAQEIIHYKTSII